MKYLITLLLLISVAQAQLERSSLLGRRVADSIPGLPPHVPDTIRFNFTETFDPCPGWTNVWGKTITGGAVRTGVSNGVTLSTVALANWAGISGNNANDTTGTTAGVFFTACNGTLQAVMKGSYYNNFVYDHAKVQFELSGLRPNKTYTFRGTGSTSANANRQTGVRVEGLVLSAEQTFPTFNNTTAGVTFTGVQPTADGRLFVFMYRTGTNGSAFGAMELIEDP